MDKKSILSVNKLVFEFILNLSELELKELLKNNTKLTLVKCKSDIKDNNVVENKVSLDLMNKLKLISNKEEATEYLSKFKVVELKKIAKELSIFVKSKSKKSEIIERIVEGTIGSKIKIDILKS